MHTDTDQAKHYDHLPSTPTNYPFGLFSDSKTCDHSCFNYINVSKRLTWMDLKAAVLSGTAKALEKNSRLLSWKKCGSHIVIGLLVNVIES